MVDVSEKDITMRTAKAYGRVYMSEDTVNMIKSGGIKKGDVLSVAQVGGIMAAKRTSEIIPRCHPVMTTVRDINFDINKDNMEIYSTVKCKGETCLLYTSCSSPLHSSHQQMKKECRMNFI